MIRKLLNGDIDRVADIWLKTNLKAHYFISNQYWKSNYELVKEMMSQSEVYGLTVALSAAPTLPPLPGRFRRGLSNPAKPPFSDCDGLPAVPLLLG